MILHDPTPKKYPHLSLLPTSGVKMGFSGSYKKDQKNYVVEIPSELNIFGQLPK